MENPGWLKLVVVGLVLSAMAGGYFLLSSRLVPTKSNKSQETSVSEDTPKPSQDLSVLGQVATPSVSPTTTPIVVTPTNPPAYTRIAQRVQGRVETLPNTGVPVFLVGVGALSAMVVGLSLSKFPY